MKEGHAPTMERVREARAAMVAVVVALLALAASTGESHFQSDHGPPR